MKKTTSDGRKNNGAKSRGLMEATTLIRGPAELFDAMRAFAKANGHSLAWVWRQAAAEYLAKHAKRGRS